MEVLKLLMIAILFLCIIGRVLIIGDEREPVTKGEAVVDGVLNSVLIYLLLNL